MTKVQMIEKAHEFAKDFAVQLHNEMPGAYTHEEACKLSAEMGVRFVLESIREAA